LRIANFEFVRDLVPHISYLTSHIQLGFFEFDTLRFGKGTHAG
jgi:hypothetical protein